MAKIQTGKILKTLRIVFVVMCGIAPQNQAKGIGCTAKGNLCRQ